MESMDSDLARKTVKFYACSQCWGELELTPDLRGNGMYFVICKRCQDDTKGYVTQYYVNKRRTSSVFEEKDVTRLLQRCGIIQRPVKSQAQLLNELGF